MTHIAEKSSRVYCYLKTGHLCCASVAITLQGSVQSFKNLSSGNEHEKNPAESSPLLYRSDFSTTISLLVLWSQCQKIMLMKNTSVSFWGKKVWNACYSQAMSGIQHMLKALTIFLEVPVIRLCRIHVHTDLQKQHPLLLILDWVWKLLDTGFLLSKIPVQECSPIKERTCTFSTHSSPSKIARHKFASNNSNGQAVLVNPQSNPESDFYNIVE